MFTSRAEYRLLLRADNADQRLTAKGHEAGLVGEERFERLREKQASMEIGRQALQRFFLPNSEWAARGFGVKPNGEIRSAEQMLHVPKAELSMVEEAMIEAPHGWRSPSPLPPTPAAAPGAPPRVLPTLGREAVEIEVKYANYLERQEKEVNRLREHELLRIPSTIDYASLPCLSQEEVEKLSATQPATLRDAGLIPGITPKALLYIFNEVKRPAPKRI